jgi:cell division protein FtsB
MKNDKIEELTAKNSELQKQNEALENELKKTKEKAHEQASLIKSLPTVILLVGKSNIAK